MDGVTIITTANVLFTDVFILVCLAFGSLLFGILAIYLYIKEDEFAFLGIAIMTLIATAFSFFGIYNTITMPKYKVIADNSVALVEFTEEYVIIKQDGNVFTVKERK